MKFEDMVKYIEENSEEHIDRLIKENNRKIKETFVNMRNIIQNAIKENGISKEEVERIVNETKTKSNRKRCY